MRMQRTPRPASAHDKKQETPRNKEIANAAIIGTSALLVAGLGLVAVQNDQAQARNAGSSSTYTPPVEAPTVERPDLALFIGDSYTAGAGIHDHDEHWPALVADEQGWVPNVVANGGTGYGHVIDGPKSQDACGEDYCPNYLEVIEAYQDVTPQVVVIAGGRNDWATPLDRFAEEVDAVLAAATEKFPNATLYVVNPVWDNRDGPDDFSERISVVEEAAKAADVEYVNLGLPLDDKPELIQEDGVHPTKEGHAVLADAFVSSTSSA